jgi:hypothetical protein
VQPKGVKPKGVKPTGEGSQVSAHTSKDTRAKATGKPNQDASGEGPSSIGSMVPEASKEVWGPKKGKKPPKEKLSVLQSLPLIPWGGAIEHGGTMQVLHDCEL